MYIVDKYYQFRVMTSFKLKCILVCLAISIAFILFYSTNRKTHSHFELLIAPLANNPGEMEDFVAESTERSTTTISPIPPLPKTFVPLTEKEANRVEKFAFFFGWGATGSSVIGSLLDAHPNIIIPHEYGIIEKWAHSPEKYYKKKTYLFNELYSLSYHNAFGGERRREETTNKKRGYSFGVDQSWQGQYGDLVSVIGDKRAGPTSGLYMEDPSKFREVYKQIEETVNTTVSTFFVVRNPFDIIAKVVLQIVAGTQNMRELHSAHKVFKDDIQLTKVSREILSIAKANSDLLHDPNCNMTVFEVHNADYINHPRETVQRMCKFLEVECSEQYLQSCEKKAFKEGFRTRELIQWPPELIKEIENDMKKYPFLVRYSFNSE